LRAKVVALYPREYSTVIGLVERPRQLGVFVASVLCFILVGILHETAIELQLANNGTRFGVHTIVHSAYVIEAR
jgi:hypothetical protein